MRKNTQDQKDRDCWVGLLALSIEALPNIALMSKFVKRIVDGDCNHLSIVDFAFRKLKNC
jgi:hypothetical protein